MAQTSLTVHGRSYQVTCDDGQESHLIKLAEHINRKMGELEESVGPSIGGGEEPERRVSPGPIRAPRGKFLLYISQIMHVMFVSLLTNMTDS
jgi:hypothetical protein